MESEKKETLDKLSSAVYVESVKELKDGVKV